MKGSDIWVINSMSTGASGRCIRFGQFGNIKIPIDGLCQVQASLVTRMAQPQSEYF